jgi:hypothetical protein
MLVCAVLILFVGQLAAVEGDNDVLGPMKHSADNSLKEKLCECSQKCIFRPDDRICFQNCMVGRDSTCYSCQENKPCDDKAKETPADGLDGKKEMTD